MTFGQFAVGLGLFLMVVQLGMIFKVMNQGPIGVGMKWTMLVMAFATPAFAWLAFYVLWPELGMKPLGA